MSLQNDPEAYETTVDCVLPNISFKTFFVYIYGKLIYQKEHHKYFLSNNKY